MNLEIQSRLSFYRRLEEVEHKKGISLGRHLRSIRRYIHNRRRINKEEKFLIYIKRL